MVVRPAASSDREAVEVFLETHGSVRVARLDALVDARKYPSLVAEENGRLAGLLTYVVDGERCEILTLHTAPRGRGTGTALIAFVERVAAEAGCHTLWLITTNDNVGALRFYQRRGFRLVSLHAGAVDRSRATLKPEIPEVGDHGIPLRDELELEKEL